MSSQTVADRVGHISISGVHGRHELNERLENGSRVAKRRQQVRTGGQILAGVALGVVITLLVEQLVGRRRRSRRFW